MKLKAGQRHAPVIPTASMADIAFLLVVFFLLTFQIEVDKTQVHLPRTQVRLEVPKKSAYISVTHPGEQIRVSNGEELSVLVHGVEDVLSFAHAVVSQFPGRPFVLKADNDVRYDTIDQIIDALKQARAEVIYLLSDQETVGG
jgi:biopolymer transport protein ExbD